MRTVTLAIASRQETTQRFLRACAGEAQGERITFESPALLFSVLTASRWELLKMMTGAGLMTLQSLAQRLQRDIQVLQDDVQALVRIGILNDVQGDIEFPFDAVHVDFMLKAA